MLVDTCDLLICPLDVDLVYKQIYELAFLKKILITFNISKALNLEMYTLLFLFKSFRPFAPNRS